jgi:hypothetical protein
MKSLEMMTEAFQLASGLPVFGDATRFDVPQARRVAYVTEEDGERLVHVRLRLIEAGLGVRPAAGMFRPVIRRGLNLDSAADRGELLTELGDAGTEVLYIEPIRAMTALAEKTAAEFKPINDWLNEVQRQTACKAFVLGHHWTKPRQNDDRSDSDKASGGALFSACEMLVSYEKLDWNRTALKPADYKTGSDPKPFVVEFETDIVYDNYGTPAFGSYIRATATTYDTAQITVETQRTKLVRTMSSRSDDWKTADEWATHAGIDKGVTPSLLAQLQAVSVVAMATGSEAKELGRSPKAMLYRLKAKQ